MITQYYTPYGSGRTHCFFKVEVCFFPKVFLDIQA